MKLAIFDVFFTISQYLGNGGRYGPGYSYSLRGDINILAMVADTAQVTRIHCVETLNDSCVRLSGI